MENTETKTETKTKPQLCVVAITPETHASLRAFCKSNGFKIGTVAQTALVKFLNENP